MGTGGGGGRGGYLLSPLGPETAPAAGGFSATSSSTLLQASAPLCRQDAAATLAPPRGPRRRAEMSRARSWGGREERSAACWSGSSNSSRKAAHWGNGSLKPSIRVTHTHTQTNTNTYIYTHTYTHTHTHTCGRGGKEA